MSVLDKFRLDGKVCVITGGAGLLGEKHAEAILEAGGEAVLVDSNEAKLAAAVISLSAKLHDRGDRIYGYPFDITDEEAVFSGVARIRGKFGSIDILINNAANNPKLEKGGKNLTRLENFPMQVWQDDFNVGVTGAFLMSREIGTRMAENGGGVILNIASDLAVIAPDQRIYRKEGLKDNQQPVKPVIYPVTKHALIGLTKYLATYWADKGVRVNAISPGGVSNHQPEEFVEKLTNLIPMGRMANPDEYQAAVLFLCSDASSYMTGQNLIIDGGRTCW